MPNIKNIEPNFRRPPFLEFMPVSLFGGVMALSALCFAWRLASQAWEISKVIAELIGVKALIIFLVLTVAYAINWMRYPTSVKNEFENSVSVSFFSTVIISILLIPGILLPYVPHIANMILLSGVLMIFFCLVCVA